MASRGFEFAYDLNQSTPVIKDLTLGDSTAYLVGDISTSAPRAPVRSRESVWSPWQRLMFRRG